jgi:crossover junction endodeoxyribonuclease RuvC
MKVLGVDPGTNMGVALWDEEVLTEEDHQIGVMGEYRSEEKHMVRCAGDLASELVGLLRVHSPDFVVLEGYAHGNKFTLVKAVTIGTVLRYFLLQMEIPYLEIAPTSLKKFVTGSGKGAKDQISMWVYKRWGVVSETNNIADAVGLAHFGAALFNRIEMPAASLEAVKAVKKTSDYAELEKAVLPNL